MLARNYNISPTPLNDLSAMTPEQMSLVAFALQNFMQSVVDEIEKAGFTGLEFSSKVEMFLRCVTPTYEDKDFQSILEILEEIDPKFPKTRFYYGLLALRSLCTQDYERAEMLLLNYGFLQTHHQNMSENMSIFATHLISNIVRHLYELRCNKNNKALTNEELKYIINDNFVFCLQKTVMESKAMYAT
jgi:hypothetical protein